MKVKAVIQVLSLMLVLMITGANCKNHQKSTTKNIQTPPPTFSVKNPVGTPNKTQTGFQADTWIMPTQRPSKIAFGSCNNMAYDPDQKFWPQISTYQPDGWIWLGDVVYIDHQLQNGQPTSLAINEDFLDHLESHRETAFSQLTQHPLYRAFVQKTPHISGMWDDHDYAYNNVGLALKNKRHARQTFADFLKLRPDHPARHREDGGFYHTLKYGDANHRVLFIFLDLRTFGDYQDYKNLLGETQWTWFEAIVKDARAQLTILVSSLPVFTGLIMKDAWENFPEDKNRLLALLDTWNQPLLILSGDRHYGAFSSWQTQQGTTIHEITASGLASRGVTSIFNSMHRGFSSLFRGSTSDPVLERHFGLLQFSWGNKLKVDASLHRFNGKSEAITIEF